MLSLIKMTRPINILIAIISLWIGYYLLSITPLQEKGISWTSFSLQTLGFLFAISFGNIQNDFFDLKTDKLNKPDRPLISGKISVSVAKKAWILFLFLSIFSGVLDSLVTKTNWCSTIFFLCLCGLLFIYNKFLKHIPLLKNLIVAFLCSTPFILCYFYPTGAVETENYYLDPIDKLGSIYPAIIFAFLLTTAREIYKDLEDISGDIKAGIITFPIAAGSPIANRLAKFICIFCWLLLPLPVLQGFYPIEFLFFTAITLTPTFIAVFYFSYKQNYKKSQNLIKFAMLFGLVALIVCV